MAGRIFKLFSIESIISIPIRHKYSRGRAPDSALSLEQRLKEMNYKDPDVYYKVNIGFSLKNRSRSEMVNTWINEIQARRKDPTFERLDRMNELKVDLEKVKEDWLITNAAKDIRLVAQYYGIFDDLYGDGYFYPIVPMTIDYDFGHEELLPRVHRGNIIKPCEAKNAPSVQYKSDPNSLWTLLLTTPDGNLSNEEYEYCHWFIGNIPGNDISKGEQIIDYLRPFPPKGIGYCRYIFVLYKQDKKIDYSEYKKEQPCLNLVERNWKTYDFMRKHQDYLTPAGLAFFQSDYDKTLKDFYHNTLQMEEPSFEYDFPKPHQKPQTWFPLKEPFNLYLDRYRDPKQINKEFLLRKLKKEHPFKFPEPPLKYPNAVPIKGYVPSWLITEMKKERRNLGRINEYM